MINQKERTEVQRATLSRTILAARQRRHISPFFLRMGPVALGITSVLLIGMMAVLYLSQLGQAVAANQRLQDIRNQQAALQRQNQELIYTIAQERSPAYIAAKAREMGLIPADPKDVQILVVPHLAPVSDDDSETAGSP
ncbi:MAG: DUF1077 domain-containing protein [Ktedonobacteraceae bacterium]|nr:DUF1077 domain-containing protein [Ktedonobacteraceae bacterium]